MEKRGGAVMAITYWRYGETWRSIYGDLVLDLWRNMVERLWWSHIGDMEKRGGAFMEISYWSLLRSSLKPMTVNGDLTIMEK